MKVKEFIKNNSVDNFLVTKDGKILGIKNEDAISFGYNNKDEVLNSEIKKIETIKGHTDLIGIRL